MNALQRAFDVRSAVVSEVREAKKVGDLLRRLPSAVRRMGLVRTLEWLEVGENCEIGIALHRHAAEPLGLPGTIAAAVNELETCPRRKLFQHHRRVVELFDALAMVQRVVEGS